MACRRLAQSGVCAPAAALFKSLPLEQLMHERVRVMGPEERYGLLLASLVGAVFAAGCAEESAPTIDDRSRQVSSPRPCDLPSRIGRVTATPSRVYASPREVHAEVDLPNPSGALTKLILSSEPYLVKAARSTPPNFPKTFNAGYFPLIVLHYATDPRLADVMPEHVLRVTDEEAEAVELDALDELSVEGTARGLEFEEIAVKKASVLGSGFDVSFEYAGEKLFKSFELAGRLDGGCTLSIGEFVFASP